MASSAAGACASKGPAPMEVDVTTMPYQAPGDEDAYNMNHKKRGKAVIFCHENFKKQDGVTPQPKDKQLPGNKVDTEVLVKTLKGMGWDDIEVMMDQELTGITTKMTELKDADHSDADCVLVVVLTHGGEGGTLIDSESNGYSETELWAPFVGVQSLAGKPKILIKLACRGSKVKHSLPHHAL